MLSSIYIENYKNLRKLQIDNFGRINLISGKNNTGKSSLLEAIYIYASDGNILSIIAILKDRGELVRGEKSEVSISDHNLKSLSSLFSDRKVSFEQDNVIKIGDNENESFIEFCFTRELSRESQIGLFEEFRDVGFDTGLFFRINSIKAINNLRLSLDRKIGTGIYVVNKTHFHNNQFIHTNNIRRDENSKLFDAIALTSKEKSIIEALKIIEPRAERIAFVEGISGDGRSAVIKLTDSDDIIPLSSMGDGINRILTIILALINSSGGYLLIDEFENGLHYSVQEQLWKIIFKLSVELDIQVFATTHSNDCISSFNEILSEQTDTSLGKYIRLDNVNGEIKEVVFSSKELNIAEQQDIELR